MEDMRHVYLFEALRLGEGTPSARAVVASNAEQSHMLFDVLKIKNHVIEAMTTHF